MPGKRERRRRQRLAKREPRHMLVRRRQFARQARLLQSDFPEVVLELEIMLAAFCNVIDGLRRIVIDKHGDEEGNNPHVWLPIVRPPPAPPLPPTVGAVLFGESGFAQDPDNLFWDNTNNRLGIGTRAPGEPAEPTTMCTCGMTPELLKHLETAQRSRIRYNEGTQQLQISVNDGEYVTLS